MVKVVTGHLFTLFTMVLYVDFWMHPDVWFYLIGHYLASLLHWSTLTNGWRRFLDIGMSCCIIAGMTHVMLTRMVCLYADVYRAICTGFLFITLLCCCKIGDKYL